jgi:hypothetical protein
MLMISMRVFIFGEFARLGTFYPPFGVLLLQKEKLSGYLLRHNSSKARLTEIKRRFSTFGRCIMLLLWQRHCVYAISVHCQMRSLNERFYWHGEDSHDFKKAIRSVPG